MKRYYSHYTFIYPDIYLKNHIVEMDSDGHIVNCFPFEKEIERTEFYSGVLAFIPEFFIFNSTQLSEIHRKIIDEFQRVDLNLTVLRYLLNKELLFRRS